MIADTLDTWADVCCDGIHVYLDNCTDGTGEICRDHPAVVEVIESNLYDPDRPRSDCYGRQTLWRSVSRFVGAEDWVCYFDADEHLHDFPLDVLDVSEVRVIAPHWCDAYITEEDERIDDYRKREWISTERRIIPMFFRAGGCRGYTRPDQRIMDTVVTPRLDQFGLIKHYGLGHSVEQWERKVAYYRDEWPQYSAKWAARAGKAVRRQPYFSVNCRRLGKFSDYSREVRASNDRRLRAFSQAA